MVENNAIGWMLWISIMLNLWPSKVYSLIKIQSEYNNHYENEGLCIFCTLCTLHTLNALGTLDFQLYFGRPYDTWLPTVLSSMITIFNYIGRHEDPTVFKYKKMTDKKFHIIFVSAYFIFHSLNLFGTS